MVCVMESRLVTPSFALDEHLAQLANDSHFIFTPSLHAPIAERRAELERCLNELKIIPIALTDSGLNFVVPLSRVIRSSCSLKVSIESSLVFNGVPVLLKGEINTLSLDGTISASPDPSSSLLTSEIMDHLAEIHASLGIRPPS